MKNNKVFLLILYLIILILLPLFLDIICRIAYRRKDRDLILKDARKKAKLLRKPLVVFDSINTGYIDHTYDISYDKSDKIKSHFEGNIEDIIPNMQDNSCVILISDVMEFVVNDDKLVKELQRVSNNNLFIIGIESNSPRKIYDYNIKRTLVEKYYRPNTEISTEKVSDSIKIIHELYSIIFKIIPTRPFLYDPISS